MNKPALLIFGSTGMLAHRLREQLVERYAITALDRDACDFATADAKKIHAVLGEFEPRCIINATGYTAVDKAEAEPELAHRINGEVPGMIAAAARALAVPFVHFSTDYVFDGSRNQPYTEAVKPNPLSIYGRSKLAGERAVRAERGYVFRLQWVYDSRGKNFLLTLRKLLAERDQLSIVADQIGAPSWASDIAAAIVKALPLIETGRLPADIYHLTARGHTTWHGFACAIAAAMHSTGCISAITSAEYPLPATRPKDGRLDCSTLAAYGIAMPHWREGIAAVIRELERETA